MLKFKKDFLNFSFPLGEKWTLYYSLKLRIKNKHSWKKKLEFILCIYVCFFFLFFILFHTSVSIHFYLLLLIVSLCCFFVYALQNVILYPKDAVLPLLEKSSMTMTISYQEMKIQLQPLGICKSSYERNPSFIG